MLTTLKDIFRLTWKKMTWTVVLGLPVTLFGFYLLNQGIRHSPLLLAVAFACLLPTVLAGWLSEGLSFLAHPGPLTLLLLVVLQFMYFYVLVCLFPFGIRRIREGP